jgi:1-acyl-sn-glycerol-3-phosphate acyltransferase
MNYINIFYFIWRIWLWVTVLFGLILFFPLGIVLISFKKTYWLFHLFCRWWCRLVLLLNGFWYQLSQDHVLDNNAYIICPNHTSKFDIILLFATFPGTFVFMGKQGVTNIPFFEWFYNKTMITFKRGSVSSAYQAYRKADSFLKRGVSIVIFPEGGVPSPDCRLQKFKRGAFKLAIDNQIPIVPITFIDNKRKYPEDSLTLKFGSLRVVIHELISTKGLSSNDLNKIKNITFNLIDKTLMDYENK